MPHHQLFRTYREQLRNLRHVWLSSNIQGRGWACDAIGNQPRSNDVMMRRACAWCGASSMTPSICTACSACVQRGEYAFGPTARRGWAQDFAAARAWRPGVSVQTGMILVRSRCAARTYRAGATPALLASAAATNDRAASLLSG